MRKMKWTKAKVRKEINNLKRQMMIAIENDCWGAVESYAEQLLQMANEKLEEEREAYQKERERELAQ